MTISTQQRPLPAGVVGADIAKSIHEFGDGFGEALGLVERSTE